MDIKRPRPQAPVQQAPPSLPASPNAPVKSAKKSWCRPITKAEKRSLWIIATSVFITVAASVTYLLVSPRMESEPSFQALLPVSKSIRELDGWTRVSPPNQSPAFSYEDTIDDVTIKVSQQELQNASQSIGEIAKAYNATDKVTASSTTVYIGTSFKGPQSVLFAKGNLLVLIGSESKVSNDSWVAYINSLE